MKSWIYPNSAGDRTHHQDLATEGRDRKGANRPATKKHAFLSTFARSGVLYWSAAWRWVGRAGGGTSMSVTMRDSEVNGVSVVELDGRIVLGEESNSLREKLKSLIAAGKRKIVLNMANVRYIDSAGLGALVAGHVSAKTQGASVRLCNLGQKFHEVLQVTRLMTVFDVYDTQAAAVSSF
jgi:anti-sigma B factor antagonist